MTKNFDAALIGAGGFARNHMIILERLQDEQMLKTVAVADPNIASIAAGADWKYKSGFRYYESLQGLLAEEACDLISIATPPFLHFDMVDAVLRKGHAFVYLEKPPVPLYTQLERLLENPASERVAVGFQFLESDLIQDMKRRLIAGEIGEILSIRASSATPRGDDYYQRSGWAGRLTLGENPVFDGPATNGLAHLVHLIMYFGATTEAEFAAPETVSGRYLRARPMEAYDFSYIEGRLRQGPAFELAVCHCSSEHHPWVVRVQGTKGEIVFRQTSLENFNPRELLYQSYRSLLRVMNGESDRHRTRLRDCAGYLLAVCGAFAASRGVADFDPSDIRVVGENRIYSVEKAIRLIQCIAEGGDSRPLKWFDMPPQIEADSAARREDLLATGTFAGSSR